MDDRLRIPGREFPAMGYLLLAAFVAVAALALIGVGTPGIVPLVASNLIIGGVLLLLAIVVPIALIRMGAAAKHLSHDLHDSRQALREDLAAAEQETLLSLSEAHKELDAEVAKGHERGRRLDQLVSDHKGLRLNVDKSLKGFESRIEAAESEASTATDKASALAVSVEAHERKARADMEKAFAEAKAESKQRSDALAKNLLATEKQLYETQEATAKDLKRRMSALRHAPIAEEEVDRIVALACERVERRFVDLVSRQEKAIDAYHAWMDNQMEAFLHEGRHSTPEHGDTPAVSRDAPFGHVYPVLEVEGIGEKTAYRLQSHGILDTRDLWHADARELARDLEIVPTEVRRWQAMAELMAVDGIGKQSAELLVACKVGGILQLAQCDARDLTTRVLHADKAGNIQAGRLSEKTVQNWIDAAKKHGAKPAAKPAKAAKKAEAPRQARVEKAASKAR